MFPKAFSGYDHKQSIASHTVLSFDTKLSEDEVLKGIKEKGFSKFLNPDVVITSHGQKQYNDGRINGLVTYHAQCCSFTKCTKRWLAIPILPSELRNVGLDADDLVRWIKYLNGMRAGLKYLYFGQQPALEKCNRTISAESYWVLIPPPPAEVTSAMVTYMHWICLRYLINTTSAGIGPMYLCYYHIPRIAVMLHEEYKLTKWRAFLFAHLAGVIYSYYGVVPTDSSWGDERYKWDLSVKASDFKRILEVSGGQQMNNMLTEFGSKTYEKHNIRTFIKPTYDQKVCVDLFQKGDYAGFIKHIRDSYKSKTKTTKTRNVREEVVG